MSNKPQDPEFQEAVKAAVKEEKKAKSRKKWIIIGVIALILVLLIAMSGGDSETKTTTTVDAEGNTVTETVTAAPDEKLTYNVGETYTDNYCSITMTGTNLNFTNYNPYSDVPSGYKVIQATFDFTNNGTDDFLADAYSFDCYADNESCEEFYYVDDSGFSDTLSAGKQATGRNVYFLVPENAGTITLEYETNMWTDNRVVFNVQ